MYKPIYVIYPYLSIPEKDMDNFDLWILEAMRALRLYPLLEHTAETVDISSNQGELPSNIIQLAYVAKLEINSPPTCEDCKQTEDVIDCTCCSEVSINDLNVGLADKQVCRIRYQGITYVYDYYGLLHNPHFSPYLELMTHRSIPFRNASSCEECPDLASTCSETYEIMQSKIITSFEEGTVCIDYYRIPTDDKGRIMLYDHETYLQYISAYIMYKYHERKWNLNIEGSERRMSYYQDRYFTLKRRLQGELLMELHDVESIRQEVYKNINILRSPQHWNMQSYWSPNTTQR